MASSLPDSTLGTIQIPYFGRILKQAGDRVFSSWQVQILNDEDFSIRNDLETWSNSINSLEGNIRNIGRNSTAYKSQAQVWQYARDGTMLREYTFFGIWPAQIDPIQLDWGGQDQIQTYGVNFEYDWYEPTGGITGSYPV